jgi:hypothetical protein
MNDWLTGLLGDVGLNGSTAPNSTAIPLATPVDTSGGNTNTSGSALGSLLSSLSGLGTTAANAYAVVAGTPAPQAAAPAAPAVAAATSSLTKYLPWVLIGAAVLVVIGFLTRSKK